jgi:alpha-glucosidase
MKLVKILIILFWLLNMPRLMAQSPVLAPGNLVTDGIGEQGVSFTTTNAYGKVTVYSPSIIRVQLDKKPLERDFSYAVVGGSQKTKIKIVQNSERITLTTDSLSVLIINPNELIMTIKFINKRPPF